VEWFLPIGQELYRVLKPDGTFILNIKEKVVNGERHTYRSNDQQAQYTVTFAKKIREIEAQMGHKRTILAGDLNMSPFEHGITSVLGLNATMSRRKAMEHLRQADGMQYPYFYNPMWNLSLPAHRERIITMVALTFGTCLTK
jgi:hypothetical protein